MVLIAANPRGTKSVYRSNSIPASLNDNFDDFSVAVTVKQSNVTIEKKNMTTNPNEMNRFDMANIEENMNRFFDRFGEFRSEAEQIVRNASDAPKRTMEFLNQLVQLYTEKVGAEGVEDCYAVFTYGGQLLVARALMPVVNIQQDNVDDVDSTGSIGSSILKAFGNLEIGGDSGGSVSSSIVGSTTSTSVDSGSNHGRIHETMNTHGALPITAQHGSHSGSVQSMDTGTNSGDMMLSIEDPNRVSGAHSTSSMSEDKDLA